MKSLMSLTTLAFPISLLGSAIAGLTPIFVRLSEVDSTATGFYRFFFALPFLWIWSQWMQRQKQETPSRVKRTAPKTTQEWGLIIAAGSLFGVDVAMWNYSIMHTTVANASILANLSSVYVAAIGVIFLGEVLSTRFILGMATSLVGSMILIGLDLSLGWNHFLGDMCALMASVTFGTYMLIMRKLRQTLTTPTIMMGSAFTSALVLGLIGMAMGDNFIPVTTQGWLILFCMALFTMVIGHGLVNYAMAYVTPALTTVGMLIQPALCSALAWFMFGETLTIEKIAGIILVLIGISIAHKEEEKTHETV